MANPAPYEVGYSFSGYQATSPRNPLPAPQIDAEFAGVAAATAAIVAALADIRRSDGALKNGVVTLDALASATIATLSGGAIDAWAPSVAWATGLVCTSIAPATVVYYSGSTYVCKTSHTAGATFDATKWTLIAAQGATGPGTGDLLSTNNLDDVADAPTARTNLGAASATALTALSDAVTALTAVVTAAAPKTGDVKEVAYTGAAETGWLDMDGSAVSRTTYSALFAKLVTGAGFTSQDFTVTIATPGVVTKSAHGFVGGERLRLSTTGALPTGLNTTSDYFVEVIDANTFYLLSAARGGSRVGTSGSQSGTHSYVRSLYGLGDGSTTFNLPDRRDEALRGISATRPLGARETNQNLQHTHTFTGTPVPDHTHGISADTGGASGGGVSRLDNLQDGSSGSDDAITTAAGGHTPAGTISSSGGAEVRVNATFVRWLIKT